MFSFGYASRIVYPQSMCSLFLKIFISPLKLFIDFSHIFLNFHFLIKLRADFHLKNIYRHILAKFFILRQYEIPWNLFFAQVFYFLNKIQRKMRGVMKMKTLLKKHKKILFYIQGCMSIYDVIYTRNSWKFSKTSYEHGYWITTLRGGSMKVFYMPRLQR